MQYLHPEAYSQDECNLNFKLFGNVYIGFSFSNASLNFSEYALHPPSHRRHKASVRREQAATVRLIKAGKQKVEH
ncbi:hypothetical protein OKW21_004187 [Catalinimonas alkaloidigena]|uniref:hypothetical protein n=1 Tax=Catalinimonas alkaloidigena TaxID=1075417 RepID=UPI0024069A72|nr:hypothetical protein [Catalinimonas alkaloidigena]MDF9798924.1 hypothetical protein [Catalinimonas alkaloidigena]